MLVSATAAPPQHCGGLPSTVAAHPTGCGERTSWWICCCWCCCSGSCSCACSWSCSSGHHYGSPDFDCGYCLLLVCCLFLRALCSLLLFIVCCSLFFVVCCLLIIVPYSLFVDHCSLSVVCCSVFVVCYLMLAAVRSLLLFTVRSSLCAVACCFWRFC